MIIVSVVFCVLSIYGWLNACYPKPTFWFGENMTTDWSNHFAKRTHRMQASAIRELLKVAARPEVISFAGGLPAPETFPVQAIAAACERILATNAHVALQYAPSEGVMALREQVAAMYRARGVPATVDNVL